MLSDIEKMIYCMVGKSSTEKDGCLVVSCNEESKSEKEYIFVTNLPYEVYPLV